MKGHFTTLYIFTCISYLILFFIYWFGSELHPILELLTVIPWWLHILPVLGLSVIHFLYIRRLPSLGIMIIGIFSLPFLLTAQTVSSNLSEHTEDSLRVCSFNTKYYFINTDVDEALKKLKKFDCDVYFLQEVWRAKSNKPELEKKISENFEGYFSEYDGEFITLSRFPIENTELGKHESFLKTGITKDGVKVSLYNVHFWNPLFGRPCQTFQNQIYTERCTIPAYDLRLTQANELRTAVNAEKDKLVVAGDFNSLTNAKIIQDLRSKFISLSSDSVGSNATFQSTLPLIKIDYFFISPSLNTTRTGLKVICDEDLSDHCLSIAQVEIPVVK